MATAAPDGRWTVIDLAGVRGGYSFGHVVRDGAIEIVDADPAFVSAFAAPEQSVAPLRTAGSPAVLSSTSRASPFSGTA